MKVYLIKNYVPDIEEAWGDADYYYTNKVTVVIYKRRSDGKPYLMKIKENENVL